MVKRHRVKRFFFVFSVLLSLFVVNIGLFTVGASAANTVPYDRSPDVYTIGTPVTLQASCWNNEAPTSRTEVVYLPRPNVYLYDGYAYSYWNQGDRNFDFVEFQYTVDDWSDMFISWDFIAKPTSLSIDSPVLFQSTSDLTSYFNFTVGLQNPVNVFSESLSSALVSYYYTFMVASEDSNGDLVYSTVTVSGDVRIYLNTDNYLYIPLYNFDILTDDVVASYSHFLGSDGNRYCYLVSGGFGIDEGLYSNRWFLTPTSSNTATQPLDDYTDLLVSRYEAIYAAETYNEVVVFDNVSWTDWIINAVGGFLDFEIVPGLSFAGMLGLLIGMSLFIIFLKVFAGG